MRFPSSSFFCEEMDKVNMNFLWQGFDSNKRVHLISWSKVCILGKYGGLRIRKANPMNQALLMKLHWRLLYDDSSIWAQILKCKYNFNHVSRLFEYSTNLNSCQWLELNWD